MKKKLLSLLLALAMVFTLAACGEKKPDPGKDATATEPVVILHTNDVHGAVSNYAKVAALASQYESEGAYVLILDAGDFSQGDTAVSVSEGATAVELMNMVGYDAVALGNHEFDYGFEALKKNMENAQFPVLAANVKYNGELAFDDAAVFTTPGGTKIGVFGLDTPETATKAHPGKIQGVTFAGVRSCTRSHRIWRICCARTRAATTSSAWATWASTMRPLPPATALSTC